MRLMYILLSGYIIFFTNIYGLDYSNNNNDSLDFSTPVNIIYNDDRHITNLIFIDTLTKKLINRYDVKSNNPFYDLEYISTATKMSDITFGLDSIHIDSFISPADRDIYHRQIQADTKVNYAYVRESLNLELPNHIIIANSLILKENMWSVGCMNSINVLDIKGNRLFNHGSPNLNVGYTTISDDGRYLAYTYGNFDEGGYLLAPGFRIVDTESDIIILDSCHTKKTFNKILVWSTLNYIIVEYQQSKFVYETYVYDLDKRLVYSRLFAWDERKEARFKKNGITVRDSSGNLKQYIFNKDFNVKPLI